MTRLVDLCLYELDDSDPKFCKIDTSVYIIEIVEGRPSIDPFHHFRSL